MWTMKMWVLLFPEGPAASRCRFLPGKGGWGSVMILLITDAWKCTREQREYLADLGHKLVFLADERDPLPVPCADVEGVICNGLFLHHPIGKFTNLRYIQLTSAGFDRVPVEYIRKKNIALYNARGAYSIPMAEFAVGSVLQFYRQSRFFARNQAAHLWQKHRGLLELYGKTVCIIGCGSVGTECAKRFRAFGCRVVGIDLHPRENRWFSEILPVEQLEQVLTAADIVILSCPLTAATRHLINRQRLAVMKQGTVLVNISRGATVDTGALVQWLREERGAAALDVFEEEPLSEDSSLWQMENVILTPHNSFVGDGNGERLFEIIKNSLGKE